ncbi:MAG: cob(I)alamin adenosyltransferase [Gammaproteobacteria bacterium]|jgi:cob(I)alamin adenosyltransferase
MGNRLSKIYTRTGDAGTTGLGDGGRTSKNAIRVRSMGDIDELNSLLGVLRTDDIPSEIDDTLLAVQHDLFDLGGEISIPGSSLLPSSAVERLEGVIDRWNSELPALKEFILPGGSRAAAHCHLARAVCRRAERVVVELADSEPVNDVLVRYVNRLSDLLFVLARTLARHDDGKEVMWDRSRLRSTDTER